MYLNKITFEGKRKCLIVASESYTNHESYIELTWLTLTGGQKK